jgi:E3 ubiquitin-protein ligase HERC4
LWSISNIFTFWYLIINIDNGKLFGFGFNRFGQLGLNDNKNRTRPTELNFFSNMKIKKISCGGTHTFVILGKHYFNITENGKIFGFGCNTEGQLGIEDKDNRYEPTEIKSLENLEIDNIFCGLSHSIAISSLF